MQLRHLKTFVAVASELSITRAAQRVHLSQSSVTEQVQGLEAELGAALFDRSGRKLRLTEAGLRFADFAARLLALAEEARAAVAEAARTPRPPVRLGALETLCATWAPPVLARIARAHPDLQIVLGAASSAELRTAVRDGALDIAFLFGAQPADLELESEVLGHDELMFVAPPDSRLARHRTVGPEDVVREAFLVTQAGCAYRAMFEAAFPAERPARPRIAGEIGSISAMLRLVGEGLGCALAPHLAIGVSPAGLIVRPWAGAATRVPISAVWRRGHGPAGVEMVLSAARERSAASDEPMAAVDV